MGWSIFGAVFSDHLAIFPRKNMVTLASRADFFGVWIFPAWQKSDQFLPFM
jgi:hypothetical protein